jgi:hypothetical protein
MLMDCHIDSVQPVLSLFQCARDHDSKHFPVKLPNTAEIENAILPKELQRVTEDFAFSFGRGIRCVEYNARVGLEKSYGYSFTLISLEEFIRRPGSQDPINPSLEDCGRLPPPVGMHDDDPVSRRYLQAVLLYLLRQEGFGWDFFGGKYRVESLGIQVVKYNGMAVLLQP